MKNARLLIRFGFFAGCGLCAYSQSATVALPSPAAPVAPHAVVVETRSAFFHLADTALRRGELSAAEAMIAGALAKNPADSEALLLRARLRMGNRDLVGAEADINTVVAAGGSAVAEGYGRLASLRLAQKRTPEASTAIAKALELSPDQPDALLAQANFDLQQRNAAGALEKVTRATMVRPNFEEAYGARAMILMQLGRTEEGVQVLKENLAKNPESIMLHVQLAGLYIATARIDLMRAEVDEIKKLKDPRAPQVAAALGDVANQLQARMQKAATAPVAPQKK
ncbi:MAG: Tetratricopeptide repeat [Verrucomicrobia bacterium]|nr:Tetratricopeptide repeat [Verrucomicrobiota bacterium]